MRHPDRSSDIPFAQGCVVHTKLVAAWRVQDPVRLRRDNEDPNVRKRVRDMAWGKQEACDWGNKIMEKKKRKSMGRYYYSC